MYYLPQGGDVFFFCGLESYKQTNHMLAITIMHTDHHLDHNRPNIVVLEKASRVCQIIDVACPFDTRIVEKEREKIDHYQDLKVEIHKRWNCKSVSVVPIVIGALGAVTKNLMMWVTKI